jgi:hypothetical protein
MKAQSFGDESKAFSQLLRRRTLEINPHHQIIKDLNVSYAVYHLLLTILLKIVLKLLYKGSELLHHV